MARVLLIHWNAAEARERAARLRGGGHAVSVHSAQGEDGINRLRARVRKPPDAVVIDLSRLPSQGREIGSMLRRAKATRSVPLVFVDGEAEKVGRVRALLPDAVYTDWPRIRSGVRRALRFPPTQPAVPRTMQSYAASPLPKKLNLRRNSTVALWGAPAGFERTLTPLPENVRLSRRARLADTILLFARSVAELARLFPKAARGLRDGGGLWLLWPKKSSGVRTDLDPNVVRRFGLGRGFVDYKICAVDNTWSGLLFARRKSKRA